MNVQILAQLIPTRLDLLHVAQWVGAVLGAFVVLGGIALLVGRSLAHASGPDVDDVDELPRRHEPLSFSEGATRRAALEHQAAMSARWRRAEHHGLALSSDLEGRRN